MAAVGGLRNEFHESPPRPLNLPRSLSPSKAISTSSFRRAHFDRLNDRPVEDPEIFNVDAYDSTYLARGCAVVYMSRRVSAVTSV